MWTFSDKFYQENNYSSFFLANTSLEKKTKLVANTIGLYKANRNRGSKSELFCLNQNG